MDIFRITAFVFLVLGTQLDGPMKAQEVPQSKASASKTHAAPAGTNGDAKREFKIIGMGDMETQSGIHLGFTDFRASDGVGLWVYYLAQSDRVRAEQAFAEELSGAVEVVDKGPKKNQNGSVVGIRAEILVPSGKLGWPPTHAVIWTDGPTFHLIGSGIRRHVLELEKVYTY